MAARSPIPRLAYASFTGMIADIAFFIATSGKNAEVIKIM